MTSTYFDYIRSDAWLSSTARMSELAASGFRCRTCNVSCEEAVLNVHHRTYARLGRERRGDLTTLCRECHLVITDALRRRHHLSSTPIYADVPRAIEKVAPLFDPTR